MENHEFGAWIVSLILGIIGTILIDLLLGFYICPSLIFLILLTLAFKTSNIADIFVFAWIISNDKDNK